MHSLSHEHQQSYYETMPRLAGSHAGEGAFSLLDTNPLIYPAQLIDRGYLTANPPSKREIDLDSAIEIASNYASNLRDIAIEIYEENGNLLDDIERIKYGERKTIIFVGDHDSFDNIVYPDMALALAEAMRHKATDRPDRRTIIMAKQLGWYGIGHASIVDMLQDYANIALTAPGTISGKATDEEIRQHINDIAVPKIVSNIEDGEGTVTFAYAGQTNRKIMNPLTDEPLFSVQYTPSSGSLDLLTHPNVVVIPFATHRDLATKKMTFAYGEPRPLKEETEARELGDEIAYLSWRISGVHTVQALDKKQFDLLTAGHTSHSGRRSVLGVARAYFSTNLARYHYDSEHGYYIVGDKSDVPIDKKR